MRTYGRDEQGNWVQVTTDENGYDDAVWLTTLCNVLKLAPEESPFYSEYGIPAIASVVQQVLPTYYANRVQSQFAQYFASLQIALTQADPPIYTINVITNSGAAIIYEVET